MSAASFKERVQMEFDAASASLPGKVLPLASRRSAVARLMDLGLPALRDDAWRYANLRPLQSVHLRSVSPDAAVDFDSTGLRLGAPLPGAIRLVFVDGRLDATASSSVAERSRLRELPPAIQSAERPADTRFALLNDAFAVDAARYGIDGECTLELVFVSGAAGTVSSYPRVQLEVAAAARLTLIERHLGGGSPEVLSSAVTELGLSRDAHCRWYRIQDLAVTATHLDTLRVRLEAGATLEAVLVQLGGGAVRTHLDCELAGRAAAVQLQAASLAGDSRTLDSSIHVRHLAADTRSQQELRAIATDRASISFRSGVCIGPAAPGADSRQSLKGLIGGDGAEVNLRPELEIDVDSVRASHGATTGAIDEAMLFYLLSRGLDRQTARQLLEWAFVETVIGKVQEPAVRREFEERTVARLGNRAALEVLA
ncbi:MAG: SufD family Fe-S cluster assembly protein [Casimicrobiaceae bacterium]